jgi:hypothetical protein
LRARSERACQQQAYGDRCKSETQESEIPAEGAAEVVADVVDAEGLVIDEPFDQVEGAPAHQHPAKEGAAVVLGCRSSLRLQSNHSATTTVIQAAAWKRPSQSVFVSSPATVVAG